MYMFCSCCSLIHSQVSLPFEFSEICTRLQQKYIPQKTLVSLEEAYLLLFRFMWNFEFMWNLCIQEMIGYYAKEMIGYYAKVKCKL